MQIIGKLKFNYSVKLSFELSLVLHPSKKWCRFDAYWSKQCYFSRFELNLSRLMGVWWAKHSLRLSSSLSLLDSDSFESNSNKLGSNPVWLESNPLWIVVSLHSKYLNQFNDHSNKLDIKLIKLYILILEKKLLKLNYYCCYSTAPLFDYWVSMCSW